MAVNFYFEKAIQLKNRKALKAFVGDLFNKESKLLLSLNYIFCSDEYLLEINKNYLNHDYYTDIITFDLSESAKSPIQGEVYISTDRVSENSQIHKTKIQEELHRVIFHGALHLCGYKDKSKQQIIMMREKERFYLAKYFKVPRGT